MQLPLSHDEIFTSMLAGRHGLAHSSIMLRTELLKKLGGYWSLPLVDDWDMMLRMGESAELANLNEVLHHYRVHEGSLNGSGMRRMRLSIDYACELARARRAGLRPVAFEKFRAERDNRPWWQRSWEGMHEYALVQYRAATAERFGGKPLRGRLRLAWAAVCGPSLTTHRVLRMLKRIGRGEATDSVSETPGIAGG